MYAIRSYYVAISGPRSPPMASRAILTAVPNQSRSSSRRITVLPLYIPQPPHKLCGIFGSPHSGHWPMLGLVNASWARRWRVLEWECLLLGKAMFVLRFSTYLRPGCSCLRRLQVPSIHFISSIAREQKKVNLFQLFHTHTLFHSNSLRTADKARHRHQDRVFSQESQDIPVAAKS